MVHRSSPRSRSRPARLALVASLPALLATVSPRTALAAAELSGVEVRLVREAEHRLSIRVDGLVAAAEVRQQIVNPGDRDTQVLYTFDLPADAAITGAEVLLADGRRAVSHAVDSRSDFRFIPPETAPGAPDLGLLRRVDGAADGLARYELRAFPVAAGKSASVVVRWVAPVRYQDGRLSLRLPDRGDGPNLVRERVEITWRAPTGARALHQIRAGDRAIPRAAAGRPARLALDAPVGLDLVLEARPVFPPGQALLAELATVPIAGGRGAAALTVIAPPGPVDKDPAYERVILVLDVSRSMGASGLTAVRDIAGALLSAATPSAVAEVVIYDRAARGLGGKLTGDVAALRDLLDRALAAPPGNGSDLGAALAQVSTLLRAAGPVSSTPLGDVARGLSSSTLVVIVTDGLLPLELDGAQAVSQIGSVALKEARVTSLVLVPDGAPLPGLHRGPLEELASRTGGRVLAVRHGEAAARVKTLWAELGQPTPLRGLQLDLRGTTLTSAGSVPDQLESGHGAVIVGWYHGRRPTVAALRGEIRGKPITARVRPGNAALRAAAVPLALVTRPGHELLGPDELERARAVGRDLDDEARDRVVRTAHDAGVATASTSLVLLDGRDSFARDRLALARRWGTAQFRRHPAPAERNLGALATSSPRRALPPRPTTTGHRRTGELDRAVVERLMKHHVVPRARACYDRALRRDPRLAGTVTIELEMARGEVQDARLTGRVAGNPALAACLLDAAYATPVPAVALGDTREAIVVARYPLRFRKVEQRVDVSPAEDRPARLDPDDPLGGIEP